MISIKKAGEAASAATASKRNPAGHRPGDFHHPQYGGREAEVVPNLMAGFGIDEKQAEYVAGIKLRNIDREYIVNRISEIDDLEKETASLRESDRPRPENQGRDRPPAPKTIKEKYAIPRKTFILYEDDVPADVPEETVKDYPVVAFLSHEGYFKKCTLASLRGNGVQRLQRKTIRCWRSGRPPTLRTSSFSPARRRCISPTCMILRMQRHRCWAIMSPPNFPSSRTSALSPPAALKDYGGSFTLFFENGKAVRIPASSYETKTNRRKLVNAFWSGSPVAGIFRSSAENEYLLLSSTSKALLVKEEQVTEKTTKTSSGASVFTLRKNGRVVSVRLYGKDGAAG